MQRQVVKQAYSVEDLERDVDTLRRLTADDTLPDAETRFRTLAARGSAARGLEILDRAGAAERPTRKSRRKQS